MTERRTQPRQPASLPLRVIHGRRTCVGWILDVSDGGVFFATSDALDPGALVKLEMDACGRKVVGLGFVVRRGRQSGAPGFGVRFVAQSAALRQVWTRFLEELHRSNTRLAA